MSTSALSEVPIARVIEERRATILARFGVQDYPDGTADSMRATTRAAGARKEVEHARTAGTLTWALLMREEICEIRCEVLPERLAEEIVDTIALLEEWLDALRRRKATAVKEAAFEPSAPNACSCTKSDAWRCAVAQHLPTVSCHCSCHRRHNVP